MRIQGLLVTAAPRRLVVAGLTVCLASGARGADPMEVVRAFCVADGHGARLDARTWSDVAPLVAWGLEPAWDRVVLVRGYEVQSPRAVEGGAIVEVAYTVAADVTPGRVTDVARLERRSYRLAADDASPWPRIAGPPPVPHVFESEVDAQTLAALLDPQAGAFVSASGLVWKLLHEAGVVVPYLSTADLARASLWTAAEEPAMGDLAVYYDGAEPYHVGFVDAEDLVVSATLNGGIRRAPADAFAGAVRYLRLGPRGTSAEAASAPATPAPTPAAAADGDG